MDLTLFRWTRHPQACNIQNGRIEVTTRPGCAGVPACLVHSEYACSPEDSSFTAIFTDIQFGECVWKAHDGQPADY